MNEQAPAFFAERDVLRWSGKPSAVEEWAYSDGLLAALIGCGAVLGCGLAALLITIAYYAGRMTLS